MICAGQSDALTQAVETRIKAIVDLALLTPFYSDFQNVIIYGPQNRSFPGNGIYRTYLS